MNHVNRFPTRTCLAVIIGFLVLPACLSRQGNGRDILQGASPAQGAPKDYRFVSGSSALQIPFEEDDGHIFFQLRINDSKPLWFGLDTGATRSIVDKRWAKSLGLKSEGSQQIEGAGGYEEGSILKSIAIKLPGVELRNQTLWGLPLEALSPASGREIAGIIGYELFKYFVVDIDFVALRINLYEPQAYEYRGLGQGIPLKVQGDGAIYVDASVEAPGRKPVEGEFVIDTGANNTLMLARPFVEQHRLLEVVGQTLQGRGGGVGGGIQIAIGRMKTLQLGRFAVSSPITGFTKVGEIADAGKAGNIGGKFLRRFHVIFDYSRQRMILEPNRYFDEPDEFDMSGAALVADGSDWRGIKVLRVRPNSAGADAGLQALDAITAIDGKPISLFGLKQMFKQDGRAYLLSAKRGEQVLSIKIKLRRQI